MLLESRNNSSLWYHDVLEELELARTATNVEVLTKDLQHFAHFEPSFPNIRHNFSRYQSIHPNFRSISAKHGPRIHEIRLKSWHSGFRFKRKRILMGIWLESRNNSSVWRPYVSEERGLARPAATIMVSSKLYYCSSNLNTHFRTFSTISAAIETFVSIFTL